MPEKIAPSLIDQIAQLGQQFGLWAGSSGRGRVELRDGDDWRQEPLFAVQGAGKYSIDYEHQFEIYFL